MPINQGRRTCFVHRNEAIEVLSSTLWGYTSRECAAILDEFAVAIDKNEAAQGKQQPSAAERKA